MEGLEPITLEEALGVFGEEPSEAPEVGAMTVADAEEVVGAEDE